MKSRYIRVSKSIDNGDGEVFLEADNLSVSKEKEVIIGFIESSGRPRSFWMTYDEYKQLKKLMNEIEDSGLID